MKTIAFAEVKRMTSFQYEGQWFVKTDMTNAVDAQKKLIRFEQEALVQIKG